MNECSNWIDTWISFPPLFRHESTNKSIHASSSNHFTTIQPRRETLSTKEDNRTPETDNVIPSSEEIKDYCFGAWELALHSIPILGCEKEIQVV